MHNISMRRLGAVGLAFTLTCGSVSAATVGKPAPNFIATTYDYKKISSADLRGKVVILNYWATWCGPCKRELMNFYKYAIAQHDPNLEIIEISDDYIPNDVAASLAKATKFPFAKKLSGDYGLIEGAVPTNYVIDRAGVVRYAGAGAFTADGLKEVISPLLAESAPPPPAEPIKATP